MSGLPVSNTPGGVDIDLHQEMAIFDILPPLIKQQLHEAPFNYCAQEVFMAWAQSGLTDGDFVRLIMWPKFLTDVQRKH